MNIKDKIDKHFYKPPEISLKCLIVIISIKDSGGYKTTVALLLEINHINLVRGKEGNFSNGLFEYINDRPYVSSSFLSTAITKVFGTALSGRADDYQQLSDSFLDLSAKITMLPCRTDLAKSPYKQKYMPLEMKWYTGQVKLRAEAAGDSRPIFHRVVAPVPQ